MNARRLNGMQTERRRKKKNEWAKNRYHRLKEQGICVLCGKEWAEPGRAYCKACYVKKYNAPGYVKYHVDIKKHIQELHENGLCVDCGSKLDDVKHLHCKKCRKRRAEYQQVRRIKARIHKGGG